MSTRSQYVAFTIVQILKLILFRRLRNPWMLGLLILLFSGMSGAFATLGVPYLFWHDNIFARMFGLIGVGVFIEEWVFVALLLDTDSKNPAKIGWQEFDEEERLKSQYYRETRKFLGRATNASDQTQSLEDKIFTHSRRLHTYATFSLSVFVAVLSYLIFSWNDLSTTLRYWQHIYMLISGIYFSVTGAFLVFLVRKLVNEIFSEPESNLSKLLLRTRLASQFEKGLTDGFVRFHKIALVKNVFFFLILFVFCVSFWCFDAPLKFTVLAAIVVCLIGMLVYCVTLLKEKGNRGRMRIVRLIFTGLHLVVIPSICWLNRNEIATSVALIASILLTLFVGLMGWIVFRSRRRWFEYIVLFAAVMVVIGSFFLARVPQVVEMGGSSNQVDHLTPNEALIEVAKSARRSTDEISAEHKGWITQFEANANKPVLVVIANSGGGIKAQVWSSVVINAVEKVVNDKIGEHKAANKQSFQHHVRLVTGTSGGMVGASHWVARLEPEGATSERPSPEEMVYTMSRDALDDVSRQMFYNDFVAFPYNILAGRARLDARGKGLEQAFENHDPIFGNTIASLKKGEDEGWRPILAFAPTVAEDGRRFLICNQPIEYTLVSTLPFLCTSKTGTGKQKNQPSWRNSIAGYSWRVNYSAERLGEPNQLKLSQAARLSANFPIFVDSPKLPYFEPALRILDAGYIDNYGGVVASQWLHKNLEWLKENTSKILFIQISASPLERSTSNAESMTLLPEANGFANASFNKTLHHTDMALSRFARDYDPHGQRCKFVTFEYQGNAALTWYLSNKEKFTLLYPFLSNQLIKELEGKDTHEETPPDSLDLNPFEISKGKNLYKKIVAVEGKRFIERIKTAKDRASTSKHISDQKYLRQLESRLRIRQQLQDIQDWWSE